MKIILNKGILLLFVLLQLLINTQLVNSQQQQRRSPCPNVFTYDTQSTDDDDTWYGTLKLQSAVQLYGITVDIIFDRRVSDFGVYHFSEATTSDNLEFRVENKNFQLDPGRTLVMNVYVKYRNYMPLVKQIRLNGQNVCVDVPNTIVSIQPISRPSNNGGASQYDYDSTTTTRKTTRRENPNNYNYNNNNNNNYETTTKRTIYNDYSNNNNHGPQDTLNYNTNVASYTTARSTTRSTSTYRPASNNNNNRDTLTFVSDPLNFPSNSNPSRPFNQERTTQRTSSIDYYNNFNNRDTTTRRSVHFPGDLPFLNRESTTHSILNSNDDECGSVIPKTNALIVHGLETYPGLFPWHAALYFSDIGNLKYICGGSLISMSSVVTAAHCVTIQKTNRAINADKLLVYLGKHNLQKWTGQEQDGKVVEIIVHDEFDSERFYSDIAILKLKDPLQKTNFVRPICIWKFDSDLKLIVDKLGSVPGWGYNENGLVSDDLSYIKMPIVTHETCIWSNRDFFSKVTSEKSFCAGFRNGTNVCNGDSGGGIVFKQGNKWYLRGIVSVSIALQNTAKCDPSHYAVFVDVAKYTTWIDGNN